MSELWICEYSPIQDCFHVDTLEKSLEINRVMLNCGQAPCYIPLGVFESPEETEMFCCEWKKKIHDQRQRKENLIMNDEIYVVSHDVSQAREDLDKALCALIAYSSTGYTKLLEIAQDYIVQVNASWLYSAENRLDELKKEAK